MLNDKGNTMILHYDYSSKTGAHIAGIKLANELAFNNKVFSVSVFMNKAQIPAIPINEEVCSTDVLFDNYVRFSTNIFKIGRKIRDYIKQNNIKNVILISSFMNSAVYIATRFLKVNIIVAEHINIRDSSESFFIDFRRKIGALFFNYYVFLTNEDCVEFNKLFNPKARTIVIPNWVEKRTLAWIESESFPINIITVGRLEKIKGYDYLLDIAKQLKNYGINFRWDIYGDGKLNAEISQEIKNYGLENKLILRGYHDNLEEVYQYYDLAVMTSRNEGLPLFLLEAASHGLPLLAFNVGYGIKDVILDGYNGKLIVPFDINQFAEELVKLSMSKTLRKEMSFQSYNHAQERFGKEYIISLWRKILQ